MLTSNVFHIKTSALHRVRRTGSEEDYLKIMASLCYNLNGIFSIPRPSGQSRFLLRAKLPTSG